MLTPEHFGLFDKYKDAGAHAFSNGVVTDDDKDKYQQLFGSLLDAAGQSISGAQFSQWFKVWSARFHRDGGMQGQRPVDLWASVINVESDIFGRYPQVYVIASSSGLEIGFGVAIHEDDYYNAEIKQRNRAIVPILYRKLPDPTSAAVRELDSELENDGVWKFGLKTRQGEMGNFTSLSELIRFLKSSESSAQGGGSVYQIMNQKKPIQVNSILVWYFPIQLPVLRP